MTRSAALLLLPVVAMCSAVATVAGTGSYVNESEEGYWMREREEGGGQHEREDDQPFLLQDMKHVVRTDAGNMKVVRGSRGWSMDRPNIHVGFITMEPNTLFIPQYLDSSIIIFVRRGEAIVGSTRKDELEEKELKDGDVYRIAAGSAFYLVNTAQSQRLHIVCSIDKSEGLGYGSLHSFFIGGGTYPTSVLGGFEPRTLSSAFNVSVSQLSKFLTRQQSGPIVFLSHSHDDSPCVWTQFLKMKQHERVNHMKMMVHFHEEEITEEEVVEPKWSFRKLLDSVFITVASGKDEASSKSSSDTYNLYNRKPDFKNNYGSSIALDQHEYSPLRHSGVGLYLVNLSAGSMMAPHLNPTATEYGIVLRGTGRIQIVYPNGTLAMNARVSEGDVFWIPRYFPFCQIASNNGPFEFFGFTTSARTNRPQFLVGANSVLQNMRGPAFAAAFGMSEERLNRIVNAQRESTILPSNSASPPDEVVAAEEVKVI